MKKILLPLLAASLLMTACETKRFTKHYCRNSYNTISSADFKTNIGDRVYFNFNKSDVSSKAKTTLEAQAAWLKSYPNATAKIEGNTDARGTNEYNLALGMRRANAVKTVLEKAGVSAARLKTISYGKQKLVVPNAATEEEHAHNRVAVTVVE